MHPERCYAAFIPKLGGREGVMIFLVKNLPAVIHASGTAKMLGTSEQSFRGHGEEENCLHGAQAGHR